MKDVALKILTVLESKEASKRQRLTLRHMYSPKTAEEFEGDLRLCAATREIVNSFLELYYNPERRTDVALHLQWNVMCRVIDVLARGYGIQP